MKSNSKLFNTFNSVKSLKLIIAFLFGFIIHDTFIRRSMQVCKYEIMKVSNYESIQVCIFLHNSYD